MTRAAARTMVHSSVREDKNLIYHYAEVYGVRIFYCEAGDKNKPTLLLPHGFPTSSHQYRQLIPHCQLTFILLLQIFLDLILLRYLIRGSRLILLISGRYA